MSFEKLLIYMVGVVPYTRNNKFVERVQLFKDLRTRLNVREGSQARVALFGLGGVGSVFLAAAK